MKTETIRFTTRTIDGHRVKVRAEFRPALWSTTVKSMNKTDPELIWSDYERIDEEAKVKFLARVTGKNLQTTRSSGKRGMA